MFIDLSAYWIFLAATLTLLLVPGPAVLYIVTRSMSQGRLAGLVSVGGISLGALIQVLAAVMGLSAILMSSALAFTVVKYVGAAYLVYLGIRTLMTPIGTDSAEAEAEKLSRIFSQGVIVQTLNPKSALFFLAFLPQFVDPTLGAATWQILFLGLTFLVMALVTDSLYALAAGTLGNWLRNSVSYLRFQRYFAGGIYILLGVTTAFTGGSSSDA